MFNFPYLETFGFWFSRNMESVLFMWRNFRIEKALSNNFKIDWAPLWMNFSILSSPVWLLFQIWINQLGWFWMVWAMNLWNLLKMGDLRHHRHSSSSMDWIGVIFIGNLTLLLVYLESAFQIIFWDTSLNNQYIFEHFHR